MPRFEARQAALAGELAAHDGHDVVPRYRQSSVEKRRERADDFGAHAGALHDAHAVAVRVPPADIGECYFEADI